MIEASAALAIAQRDFTKLFRDRARLITDVLVPVVVFGVLGGMLNFAFGRAIGYDFLIFVLTNFGTVIGVWAAGFRIAGRLAG